MPEQRTQIGAVRSVNPARRELRVRPQPGREGLPEDLAWLELALEDGTALRCKVVSARTSGAEYCVTLAAGVTRDAVARMKGAAAFVLGGEDTGESDLSSASDWLGFQVAARDGTDLGRIVEVYWTSAHGVLEVAAPDGRTIQLPVVAPAIASVDRDRRAVTVNDIARFAVVDGGPRSSGVDDED